jgi:nucleoside phosphorylase
MPSYQDYGVGWICALPLELSAAIAMLDEQHQDLPRAQGDDNTYILGRIGDHNVAMASLPIGEIGNNSAAQVASHMQRTFPLIKIGLLVGIGGGVPSPKHDIRLGDIVVSKPSKENGGVLQYDMFRNAPTRFVNFGFLNAPPRALRSVITTLKAWHEIPGQNKLSEYLSPNNPKLPPRFTYPQSEHDELFKQEYHHVGDRKTCVGSCERAHVVMRIPRDCVDPVVHYGVIASGNQIMENSVVRGELAARYGILCFEMEAAGLMNSFPCVVIRGICDYADSHKYKAWQPYAAATAAAYAKELLRLLPAEQVVNTAPISASGVASSSVEGVPLNISVLAQKSLNWDEVALGRLISNIDDPAEEYYPTTPISLSPEEISVNPFQDIRSIIKQQRLSPFGGKFKSLLFGNDSQRSKDSDIDVTNRSITYKLLNSGTFFRELIKNEGTRRWVERMHRHSHVYLTVAIHAVKAAFSNSTMEPNHLVRSPVQGDRITGVQYRKLLIRRFSSLTANESVYLQQSGVWKVYDVKGNRGEDRDSIEATLGNISLDDLEDEYDFELYFSNSTGENYVLLVCFAYFPMLKHSWIQRANCMPNSTEPPVRLLDCLIG